MNIVEGLCCPGPDRTFAVASDEAVVELITRARDRLVVIAPALTKPVADALSRRFEDLDRLSMTVILDADPEVYRLGFGDLEALEAVRSASSKTLFDLRYQDGVRIGVVISDETTMVYAPVSKNIEAGSISVDKPNAIVLTGNPSDRIAGAAGAAGGDTATQPEVGENALEPGKVEEMQANLKATPPRPFDVTRRMNVFSSKVQYLEFSASNYRLRTRQIPLPPELVDVADDDLKGRISSRIRAPFDGIGKLDITIDYDGKTETLQVDDDWLKQERKRIEDEFTFQINNFGRVILFADRADFDKAVERFRLIVEKYQDALRTALNETRSTYQKRIVDEFGPRWEQKPPSRYARWRIDSTRTKIREDLEHLANEIFESAVSFDPPVVKILYKNVAPENVQERDFLDALRIIMLKKRVPREIIESLFEMGRAAPASDAFLGQ